MRRSWISFEYLTQHNQVQSIAEIFEDVSIPKKEEQEKTEQSGCSWRAPEAAQKAKPAGKETEPVLKKQHPVEFPKEES